MSNLQKLPVNVTAISVDNASTNRKFFTDCLCGGNLKTFVTDPISGQPIFLIFDPVHDLKNVYNNFQSRKNFHCPPFGSELPTGCQANFNHIDELYKHEEYSHLKKGYKLTQSVLHPKSIEKTSVKLATAVFTESTRDALIYYTRHENKQWTGTADFITVVLKLWNVMNVKTSTKGKRKRVEAMEPVRSSTDWKLQYLRDFADFLVRWESAGKNGLTKETFLALRHTCLSLAECAAYLIDTRGFRYVLLGQLQSDSLESRFGWFRQLSGANYFISMRQVLESVKKIRALSLLKFSKISLSQIDDAIQADCTTTMQTNADSAADLITSSLNYNMEPSDSDRHIIFYISGAIARSTIATTKCEFCREVLVSKEELTPFQCESEDTGAADFLDSINRGGLMKPTQFAFKFTVHCWRVFEEMWKNEKLKTTFLSFPVQRTLFAKIMDRASYNKRFMSLVFGQNMCSAGHDLMAHIIRRFFNCVAKNFVKQITNTANAQNPGPSAKKRKIAKLTSAKN